MEAIRRGQQRLPTFASCRSHCGRTNPTRAKWRDFADASVTLGTEQAQSIKSLTCIENIMCYANFNVPIRSGIRLRPLMISPFAPALAAGLMLTACGGIPTQPPSAGHIRAEGVAAANPDIPPPVANTVTLPRPKAAAKTESYSVSVRNIPVQDLLFALARDAKLNVDIHPGINGVVTINAIDQTLQQILSRISKQIDMRWELDGPNQHVSCIHQFRCRRRRFVRWRQQLHYVRYEQSQERVLAVAGKEPERNPARDGQGPAGRLQ